MADLSILIKPVSSLCNLRCSYCFYRDESEHRKVKSYGIMQNQTAQALIDRAFEHVNKYGTVTFSFQGGEPALAELSFFEEFIQYAGSVKPKSVEVQYSMQTNGVLIDEEWCRFFRENRFLIGLSFDGTPGINDLFRVGGEGQGTSRRVLETARLLRNSRVEVNILAVVTRQMAKHPQQVLNYLKKSRFQYIQFIPCLEPLGYGLERSAYSLTPRLYASFLKGLFMLWKRMLMNGEYLSIRLFDNLARMVHGQAPEMCGMLGKCSPQFVIEADGGVYPCDFYVLDSYRAGNILSDSFDKLIHSPAMLKFLNEKTELNPQCSACPVRGICEGGCRRCRDLYFEEKGYCPYQDFLMSTLEDFQGISRKFL